MLGVVCCVHGSGKGMQDVTLICVCLCCVLLQCVPHAENRISNESI